MAKTRLIIYMIRKTTRNMWGYKCNAADFKPVYDLKELSQGHFNCLQF